MTPRAARVLAVLACICASEVRAAAPPAGEFALTGGRASADVKSWGPDCGQRPRSSGIPAGTKYQFTGTEVKGGRTAHPAFSSGVCGVATGLRGLSEARAGQRITCKSKPGASKQVEGRAALKIKDVNTLQVNHRFAYDWRLKGSHCVVTLTTRLDLARSTPIVAEAPPPEPETETPPPDRCGQPGPMANLVAKGSKRRAVKRGGRVRLRVEPRDAQGCKAAGAVAWSATAGKIKQGVLDVRGVDAATKVTVTATAGPHSVEFTVQVLAEADLAALRADQPALVEGEMAALPPQAGAGVGGAETEKEDTGGTGRVLLGVFIGFGIVAVCIGLVITRRSIHQRNSSLLDEDMLARYDALTNQPTPIVTAALAADQAAADSDLEEGGSRQCPACDRIYDADTRFCPFDSSPLDAHAPAPSEILLTSAGLELGAIIKQERICPHCSERYPADVLFCGVDGTRLVLLN